MARTVCVYDYSATKLSSELVQLEDEPFGGIPNETTKYASEPFQHLIVPWF